MPLAFVSKVLWSQQAVLRLSCPVPRAHVFDKLSRANGARVRWPAGSTSSPGRLGPMPEGPRCPTAFPGVLCFGPRTRVVDQLSRATCACILRDAVSTSCPGQLGPRSEDLRCRPAVQRDSGPGLSACGVKHPFRASRARVRGTAWSTSCPGIFEAWWEGPQGQPVFLGHSSPCPRARGFD